MLRKGCTARPMLSHPGGSLRSFDANTLSSGFVLRVLAVNFAERVFVVFGPLEGLAVRPHGAALQPGAAKQGGFVSRIEVEHLLDPTYIHVLWHVDCQAQEPWQRSHIFLRRFDSSTRRTVRRSNE